VPGRSTDDGILAVFASCGRGCRFGLPESHCRFAVVGGHHLCVIVSSACVSWCRTSLSTGRIASAAVRGSWADVVLLGL
jgi:hypothetical protein